MKINYCPYCGAKTNLIQLGDDLVYNCDFCHKHYNDFVYPCVIIACINKENKVAIIKQSYGIKRSVLVAGFIKPKEYVEDAVKREVLEELGLTATDIKYINNYPMDTQDNIMLGFRANVSGNIKLSCEVEEVNFYTLDESINILKDAHIAKSLIEDIINDKRL